MVFEYYCVQYCHSGFSYSIVHEQPNSYMYIDCCFFMLFTIVSPEVSTGTLISI